MEKLKAAIIGTGGISNEHILGYLANPNTELYAFCDINEDNLYSMAEKYGVPRERCFNDKDKMLEALPEIDIVSVTTWNNAHAECTIAALNAGKAVLCEKPMAMNSVQAQEMLETAKKNNALLQIGFVRRYGDDAIILKDYADNGYFGDIYFSKATYLRRAGNPGGWFSDKSRSGGGPLIDLGVHVIDLVRYIAGGPKPVSAYGVTYQKLFNRPGIKNARGYKPLGGDSTSICDVEDLAIAYIRFDNGMTLSLEASFCLNRENDIGEVEIFGTKAGCKLDPEVKLYTDMNDYMVTASLPNSVLMSFDDLFAREIDHFVDCALGKAECIAPAEDGVMLMKILDAVYESARTGQVVQID